MERDYYTILGVKRDATPGEIEHAYRERVRKHHPDLHPASEEVRKTFQQIQTAFDVLHSPERRAMYDLSLAPPPAVDELAADTPVTADLFEAGELDSLRFPRRTPGTAMVPYRHRGRLVSLVEWLVDSDFLVPLVFTVPLVLIHVVAVLVQLLETVFRGTTR